MDVKELFILFLTLFLFYVCALFICREAPVLQEIQPMELHVKMQDPSFLNEAQLIDVREPDEVYDPIHNFCFCVRQPFFLSNN